MKSRILSVLAVIACAALLYGCNPTDPPPQPTTAPSINFTCVGSTGPNCGATNQLPTASPSPGVPPSGCPAVYRVGVSIKSNPEQTTIRVGNENKQPLDATPKGIDGIPLSETCAPVPSWEWYPTNPENCTVEGNTNSYTPILKGARVGPCLVVVRSGSVTGTQAFTVVP